MAAQVPPTSGTSPSPWSTVLGAAALLTVLTAVLLTAFAWPSVRASVQDLPIAVAGPPAAVAQVSAALDRQLPDGFRVTAVPDTAAAERLIRDRKVYGAIDLSSGTPKVIIASAGSAAVAQTLQSVASGLGRAQADDAGTPVAVRDLAAFPADDPRGAGLVAGALPLVMGGLLAAFLLTNLVRGIARRVTGALVFASMGGLAVVAILQYWLGSLDGSFWANSGAVALGIAATSLTILGLRSLLGYAGFGLGAVTMMLIGNPLSGSSTAPEMLPGWSGALGQLLPPGASGQLLRSTGFFDGHGIAQPVIVLGSWLALGLALCFAGALRARRPAGLVTGAAAAPQRPHPAPTDSADGTAEANNS
ncbi:hypothetical protein Kfla_4001 [Kribbella flavida DSM 17836]|uniref:Integral membrane protein n=1 Tax=Kribbella flavida (strain DSM 17836 / JCM 10339 / NBRC 14399) TaxID=479435 RepID=D2PRA3_KRIFD|nr:hypothetical protein [Kribbella flavida]ADB33051.1 hypothetical protein Kfla_4001 [Kribbella flavida DSM 17836]